MNPIVNALSLIADAAEYLDRSTGAAWRIRTALTNMVVWQARSVLRAAQANDGEALHRERVKLATLRCWVRDSNASAFVLDLTAPAIRRTLGLERQVNDHDEAVRIARGKCQRTRSTSNFKTFYRSALLALEEQRLQKEEQVSSIEDLIQSNGFVLDGTIDDLRGYPTTYSNEFVSDAELYDEDAVLDQVDRFAETLGNALESMFNEVEIQLNSAITTAKIARLSGYREGILAMMKIVGVDSKALAKRQKALNDQLATQEAEIIAENASAEASIEAQLTELAAENAAAPAAEPAAPKRTSLAYDERMQQMTDAAQARANEDKAAAALAAKRSAAARKAAETRRRNAEQIAHE